MPSGRHPVLTDVECQRHLQRSLPYSEAWWSLVDWSRSREFLPLESSRPLRLQRMEHRAAGSREKGGVDGWTKRVDSSCSQEFVWVSVW